VGREFAAVGTEVPATWFGILNSLFIVCFAPVFQNGGKVGTIFLDQFGLGMTLLGLGFGFLAYGSMGINPESVVRVSMFWLIAAYLFHTLGELCISPVYLM
jgi:POT family proton-dependent oligopeptide transporter